MAVEAIETDIDLGYFRGGNGSSPGGRAAAVGGPGVPEQELHPLLREPTDVTVTVKTVSPPPSAGAGALGVGGGHIPESPSPSPISSAARIRRSGERSGKELGGPPPPDAASPSPGPRRRGPASFTEKEAPAPQGGEHDDASGKHGGVSSPASAADEDGADLPVAGGETAPPEEKTMRVRVGVPRPLRLALPTGDARAALSGCVGGNILAAGFHGEMSENFPLRAAAAVPLEDDEEEEDEDVDEEEEQGGGDGGMGEVERHRGGPRAARGEEDGIEGEGEGRTGGAVPPGTIAGSPKKWSSGAARGGEKEARGRGPSSVYSFDSGHEHQHQHRHRRRLSSSTRSSLPLGSRASAGEEEAGLGRRPPAECPVCADSFDELVARHECAWCGGTVCRKCMHTQVSGGLFSGWSCWRGST